MMHLEHRQQNQAEKCSVVQCEKTCAAFPGEFFMLRKKDARGEHDPVSREEAEAAGQSLLGRPVPLAAVEKAPEGVGGIGCEQAGEGECGPTIADEEKHGG